MTKKKKLSISSTLAFALLSAVYIFQINSLTAMAHGIANTESEISNLKVEAKSLEMQYVQNSSFTNLEELAAHLEFEKITHVSYSRVGEGAVAQQGR